MKFKKQDEVIVRTGKDKGKTGKIERVLPKLNAVVITGINQFKRHTKSQGQNKPGGIINITKPLSVANIALVCPKCKQVTRIGYTMENEEKKRTCKKCKQII